ncbi:DUF2945 domain-containing protein [Paracoccus sp. JM45]|uniref:DUF2945 domain-containing protein n=1 Tax=Paracoccus sp. JM45 TaxID=2283626 RepID=UPI000E6C4AB0|nr:DUF2945 domain-containing protein [Paracoccus sp. JM45]RJE80679.1 DUF2945 domain-containing protein [Paracoccus sp. JM45]
MLREGTKVQWNWAGHTATGKISQIFREDVSKDINGSTIKRQASDDEPAYLIEQDDGAQVLKSRSEVTRAD